MTKGKRILVIFFFIFFATYFTLKVIGAENKTWSGGGDNETCADDDNWSPAVAPLDDDIVLIDAANTSVTCEETFNAGSITLGGREGATLTFDNFVFGTVSPSSTSDVAILNRHGGKVVFKGAGTVTLEGQYQSSEDTLDPEPGFMFWVE